MAERDLGRYQMLWDCPYCETQKLLGLTHRHCPSCGAAQDPNRRYFPSDEDKVAVEDHPFTGRDKICPSCSAPSSAAATHCGACGSPLDEAKAAALRQTQEAGAGGFQADSATAADKEHRSAAQAAKAPPPAPPPKKGWFGKGCLVGVVFVGLALAVLCAVAMLWKKEAALEVTAQTWERAVAIEEYGPKEESAWCDDVPSGADVTDRREEKRSTNKVEDGETCTTKRVDNGDGTFSEKEDCQPKYREEPVYDEKCTYTVMKWSVKDKEKSSGKGASPAPSWPKVRVSGCKDVGCTREGARDETYRVELKDTDGDDYACTLGQAAWERFKVGSRWTGQVGVLGDSVDCGGLKPQ